MSLIKISIYQLIILFLTSLLFLGSLQLGFKNVLIQAIFAIIPTTLAGAILDFLELKRWTIPKTPFITGVIIALVGQFGADYLTLSLIGISAMLIKFFIKWDGRHIFNPAAAGLLIGMLFLKSYPAWWGGGANLWAFLIWIPMLLLKMKRWAPMVGFLIPVFIFTGIGVIFSTSLLFFLSVMLIEPKTSPATTKIGLIYGLIIGISYLLFSQASLDPLIASLLIGNFASRLLQKYLV